MIIKVISARNVPKFERSMNKGIWFVWYYAEWCGHCKNMKGEWDVLTKSPPKGINIASVESKSLPKMNNAPNVMGYPTIKLYDNGQEVEDYEGERTSQGFNNFLSEFIKKAKPSHKHPSRSTKKRPTVIRVPNNNILNPKLENIIKKTTVDIDRNEQVPNQVQHNQKIADIIERISNPSPIKENNVDLKSLMPRKKTKSKSLADIVNNNIPDYSQRQTKNSVKKANHISIEEDLLNALRKTKTKSIKNNNETKTVKIKLDNIVPNMKKNGNNNNNNNNGNNNNNKGNNKNNNNNNRASKKRNSKRNSKPSMKIDFRPDNIANNDNDNNVQADRKSLSGQKLNNRNINNQNNKVKKSTSLRAKYNNIEQSKRQNSFFANSGQIKEDEQPQPAPGPGPGPGPGRGRGKGKGKRKRNRNRGRGRGAPAVV